MKLSVCFSVLLFYFRWIRVHALTSEKQNAGSIVVLELSPILSANNDIFLSSRHSRDVLDSHFFTFSMSFWIVLSVRWRSRGVLNLFTFIKNSLIVNIWQIQNFFFWKICQRFNQIIICFFYCQRVESAWWSVFSNSNTEIFIQYIFESFVDCSCIFCKNNLFFFSIDFNFHHLLFD